jgi:hypothetical protein
MRFNPHAFKRTQETPQPPSDANAASDVIGTALATLPAEPEPDIGRTARCFILHYGRPGADKVIVPEHSLAVTLAMKFNDSAPQVDYWNHHAHLGCPDFLLLLVRKQNRSEHLARQALALCPELQRLDWTWRKENYMGGHGSYLASSAFPLPPVLRDGVTTRTTWGAKLVETVFWEIEFTSGEPGDRLQLCPHKHFGERPPDATEAPRTGTISAVWRLNTKLNGVEIFFSRRPDDAALKPIKDAHHNGDRWRYNGHDRCWYNRQSPDSIAFAKRYCEQFNGGIVGSQPTVRPMPGRGSAAPMTETPGSNPPEPHEPKAEGVAAAQPESAIPPSNVQAEVRSWPPRKIIRFCPTPQVAALPGCTPLGLPVHRSPGEGGPTPQPTAEPPAVDVTWSH